MGRYDILMNRINEKSVSPKTNKKTEKIGKNQNPDENIEHSQIPPIPQNLIQERHAEYRYFYNSNYQIANFIDAIATITMTIERLGEENTRREYINKFFTNLCVKLNLQESLTQILREYLIIGNCYLFSIEHNWKTTPQTKKISNVFDKNILYEGWEKLIIIPPNQIRVRMRRDIQTTFLEYRPDSETLKFIRRGDTLFPKSFLKKSKSVWLNTNPFSGSFAHHFARRTAAYDPLGLSLIERYRNNLLRGETLTFQENNNSILLYNQLKEFVERSLFLPVAIKKGFLNSDNEPIYPEVTISNII